MAKMRMKYNGQTIGASNTITTLLSFFGHNTSHVATMRMSGRRLLALVPCAGWPCSATSSTIASRLENTKATVVKSPRHSWLLRAIPVKRASLIGGYSVGYQISYPQDICMSVPCWRNGPAWFAVQRAIYLCVVLPHRLNRVDPDSAFLRLPVPLVPTRERNQVSELL